MARGQLKTVVGVVHPEAFVHESAILHPSARVDAGAVIGPFVLLGEGVVVGEGTIIEGHVTISRNVKIGKGCWIQPGVRLGQSGYGYVLPEGIGKPYGARRPHPWGVRLEDEVHVGANACVDAGSWRTTTLKRGCKLDNLVHIAHNVIVGENAMVVALAEVSGSVIIGDRAWVAPGSSIRERLNIGDDAVLGLGAAVVKDVPAGETWAGVPAKPLTSKPEFPPDDPSNKS